EQAEGKAKLVGPRSDVYSLGAILYEMLAGRPPFVGENALQVMRAALHEEPVPPRVFTPGVPRDLETICLKCLEKEPGRRYASAAEFADDLKAFLNDDPISARPLSVVERAARRVRKNPAAYMVALVALLVIVFSSAWYVVSLRGALAQVLAEKEAREKSERERLALEEAKHRTWTLVFEDDFSDVERTKRNWKFTCEKWEIRDGELHVQGAGSLAARVLLPIAGDIRLEFECHQESDYLCDVTCFLASLGDIEYQSGYDFKYGGWSNARNSVGRDGRELWSESAAPLRKGERYRACAERIANCLRYTINGKTVFDVVDPEPLSGNEYAYLGLYGYRADTYWGKVKAYRLGEPLAADLLDIAERNLERGDPAVACALFQEVLASANDAERRRRASVGLEKAAPGVEAQQRFPEMRARLVQAWPKAKSRLLASGLAVDVSKCGIRDLEPLKGLPVRELNCSANEIASLEPLRGIPLVRLFCSDNRITDLGPLQGMQLHHLDCKTNEINDLRALRAMPLTRLECGRNRLTSIEPLRGMSLSSLGCGMNRLSDLEPLRGMPLSFLMVEDNRVSSLEPLRGMKLTALNCSFNRVTDLEPLRGMPLSLLLCLCNGISDLGPVRGMRLASLNCNRNEIASLAPLEGMRLHELWCGSNRITSLQPIAELHCDELDIEGNLLKSLDPFVDRPPKRFLFVCDTLLDEELERARRKWAALPEAAALARHAEVVLAERHRDVGKLRALSEEYVGHHYLAIPELRTWDEARKDCETLGGHLVTISDAKENAVACEAAKVSGSYCWLGLTNARRVAGGEEKVSPVWVTGEPVGYTFFQYEEGLVTAGAALIASCEPGWWGCEPAEKLAKTRLHYIIEWDN
ncbi:MAG: lectin-like protein, partial [Planctomycetota bacterium]|nr:lectin-like protein [Planctomycetota bacterium]